MLSDILNLHLQRIIDNLISTNKCIMETIRTDITGQSISWIERIVSSHERAGCNVAVKVRKGRVFFVQYLSPKPLTC